MEQDKKKMANDRNADSKYEDGLTEVCMTGGPPWGFNISGGSEFGTDVFIKKVTYKTTNLDSVVFYEIILCCFVDK